MKIILYALLSAVSGNFFTDYFWPTQPEEQVPENEDYISDLGMGENLAAFSYYMHDQVTTACDLLIKIKVD